MAKKSPDTKKEAENLPNKIIVTCPYAFLDEDENMRAWGANQLVEDKDEIALLVSRGVEHEVVN